MSSIRKSTRVSSNTTSNYYEKLLEEHANKITFSDDGPTYQRVNISDFEDKETLSSTNYIVKRMLHKESKKEVAMKYINIPHSRNSLTEENSKKLKYLSQEIDNLRELRNEPNIVRMYGFCLYNEQALICMELMDFSLKDISMKFIEDSQKFPEEFLGFIIVEILKALEKCKSKGITYPDVKPDNILLNLNGAIKLCGFGNSNTLHNSLGNTFTGSLAYWPPERFSKSVENVSDKLDTLSNIWSLGITIIELVSGSVPYRDKKGKIPNNIILLQNLILTLDANETVDNHFEKYSKEIKDFIKSCLQLIKTRLDCTALLNNDYLKKYHDTRKSEEFVRNFLEKYEKDKKCHKTIIKVEPEGYSFNYDEIQNIRLINRHEKINSYIDVKIGVYRPWDKYVAIKTMSFIEDRDEIRKIDRLKNEFENFRSVSKFSSNIVQFYGYDIDKEARLYMERMDCNLRQFYIWVHNYTKFDENSSFPENLLVYITENLVEALLHCKSKSILHRDIKPTNILLNRSGEIKLCDFGSSIDLGKVENADYSRAGTFAYWAPELFNVHDSEFIFNMQEFDQENYMENYVSKKNEIFKLDIWSLGITLWETIVGHLPYLEDSELIPQFTDFSSFKKYILRIDGIELYKKNLYPNCSNEIKQFITYCLLKLEERHDIEQLKKFGHCFIKKDTLEASKKEFFKYMKKMEEGFDKKTLLKADEKKSLEDEGIAMTSGYESSYEVSRSWEASLSDRSEWQSTNKQHEEIVNLETKLHQKLANIGELNQKEVLLLEDIKKIAEEKKNLKEIEKEYKKQLECWMKKNANLDRALQQLELLASNFDITFENGVSYIVKDDQRMEVDSIFAKITYARRLALSEIYPNSSVTKSKALIINNDFSESEDPRTGTEVDEKNLQMLFENLNYDVLLEKNASAKKMLEFIKLHAESSEQANCDSFIVTILTHGDDGVVFGSDYKPIAISEIIKCANTEVLGEKPKIFIIQACRGKLHDRGIKETKTPTPYAVNQTNKIENSKEKEFEIIEQKKANVDFNFSSYFSSNDSSSSQKYADQEKETDDLRSSHADICLIYPTWPSHVAFRDTNGSWLIKSIYREFSKNAHLKSLQEMLIAVNSYVQEKCAESGTRNERTTIASYLGFKKEKITVNGPLKQTSCYNSSMGKFFYFSSANKKLE